MKKVQILKDWETGTYFTNDYECWWSRDVRDAYEYGEEQDLSKGIESLLQNNYDNPFSGKNYIELVVFYCR